MNTFSDAKILSLLDSILTKYFTNLSLTIKEKEQILKNTLAFLKNGELQSDTKIESILRSQIKLFLKNEMIEKQNPRLLAYFFLPYQFIYYNTNLLWNIMDTPKSKSIFLDASIDTHMMNHYDLEKDIEACYQILLRRNQILKPKQYGNQNKPLSFFDKHFKMNPTLTSLFQEILTEEELQKINQYPIDHNLENKILNASKVYPLMYYLHKNDAEIKNTLQIILKQENEKNILAYYKKLFLNTLPIPYRTWLRYIHQLRAKQKTCYHILLIFLGSEKMENCLSIENILENVNFILSKFENYALYRLFALKDYQKLLQVVNQLALTDTISYELLIRYHGEDLKKASTINPEDKVQYQKVLNKIEEQMTALRIEQKNKNHQKYENLSLYEIYATIDPEYMNHILEIFEQEHPKAYFNLLKSHLGDFQNPYIKDDKSFKQYCYSHKQLLKYLEYYSKEGYYTLQEKLIGSSLEIENQIKQLKVENPEQYFYLTLKHGPNLDSWYPLNQENMKNYLKVRNTLQENINQKKKGNLFTLLADYSIGEIYFALYLLKNTTAASFQNIEKKFGENFDQYYDLEEKDEQEFLKSYQELVVILEEEKKKMQKDLEILEELKRSRKRYL